MYTRGDVSCYQCLGLIVDYLVIVEIFSYLPWCDFKNATSVNHQFKAYKWMPVFWRRIYTAEFKVGEFLNRMAPNINNMCVKHIVLELDKVRVYFNEDSYKIAKTNRFVPYPWSRAQKTSGSGTGSLLTLLSITRSNPWP